MRFNKDTERGIDINEIAEQCRNAINKQAEAVRRAAAAQLEACYDLPAHQREENL